MTGPSRAGLFVYACDAPRIAGFYEAVLGLSRIHAAGMITVLEGQGMQLIVHEIPPQIAATIVIATPPVRREDTALKFWFTVTSLAAARAVAQGLGGDVDAQAWEGTGFRVSNAIDPEGNVFQVREPAP